MVCVIHTEAASRISGSLPDGSDHLIRRLFERAVSNALRLELRSQGLEVAQGRRVSWPIDIASPGIATILSGMQTDIELNQLNQTGFTGEPKARKVSYGKGKPWEPFFDRGARTCGAHGLGE
jgi:hypothetical protein